MSCQDSENLVPSEDGNMPKEYRHLANFVPDVWGDTFLAPPPDLDMDDIARSEYEELKEQVRRRLVTSIDKPSQKLVLIDTVQRLGVAYYFEKEIEEALQIIYRHHCNHTQIDDDNDNDGLYTTSVRFRLLREHGLDVDCETFNKFRDEEGKFKESLISDVKGMLELYEAAHFQVHGEIILEEALSFTKFHLKLAETKVEYPLSTQIAEALNRPLRKSLPRLVAKSYFSIYQGYGTHDQTLLKFAKLDFKIVQHLHRNEMKRKSQVYFAEAKWLHENYIPTMEEYMPIALMSCGYLNLTIACCVGLDDSITKEAFIWALNDPKILRASSTISRLMSDIVIHKFEQERGHVSSAVECYMKQHGTSLQATYDEFFDRINDAWKDITEGFLKPTPVPTLVLNPILNLAKVMDLFYKGEDAYTHAGYPAQTGITAMLIESILI
ncbi:hypothetical protein V6N11_016847 [Hibiscus sabdariffa]|uniref:(+)-delta-cadinene synthase n=1 Tax=Hibiscus sabdariffa TaxID=183260 RepID=A0ABR2TWD9_9ROSI